MLGVVRELTALPDCVCGRRILLNGSDDKQRSLLALRINPAEILAHNAEAKHLHTAKGKHNDGDAGPTGYCGAREPLPQCI